MSAKTDTILNEADSMERKLDWILFKNEQEKILFGGVDRSYKWKPGDALFTRPGNLGCSSDEQYIRPMIELIHNEMFNSPSLSDPEADEEDAFGASLS